MYLSPMFSRKRHPQSGFSVQLAIAGILVFGIVGAAAVWLLSGDSIAACVEDGSGSPPDPVRFAEALPVCIQPAVAETETPAEASEKLYDFLVASESIDAIAPLVVSNWQQTPDALKSRAFQAIASRFMPYIRGGVETVVHGTGTDDRGDFVHASYLATDAQGRRGTTLRLYLVEGPYGFSIARAEFAPVN